MFGDRPFRELDDRSWNIKRRIEDMDRDGVAIQVLSPMPELLSYWLDPTVAEALLEQVNAQIAECVALAPRRFRGFGAVPLQDSHRAAAALGDLKRRFGFSGVEIGSNIAGVMLGDPRLDPFFAAAAAEGMAVFVHALHPLMAKVVDESLLNTTLYGFPTDLGMAASSLILAGTIERHPGLRIGFSHGGGTLAAMLGRLETGWMRNASLHERIGSPRAQASRMFYDSNVYDPDFVAHLATHVAPGHIFAGTDYPYHIMQRDPAAYIASVQGDANARHYLEHGAAAAFLNENLSLSAEHLDVTTPVLCENGIGRRNMT